MVKLDEAPAPVETMESPSPTEEAKKEHPEPTPEAAEPTRDEVESAKEELKPDIGVIEPIDEPRPVTEIAIEPAPSGKRTGRIKSEIVCLIANA